MIEYSWIIGIWKSVKNVAITVGVPALLVLLNNYTEWLPEEYYPIAVPLAAMMSYFVKNKIQFKG